MKFSQIIAPLTSEEFLSNYWNRTFLHVKGRTGRFTELFTWDELNKAVENGRLSPPLLKLAQGGNQIDPTCYTSRGWGNVPRVDIGRLISRLSEGATLILDCVEELSSKVRELSESFCDTFRARNYVNLYAGWKTQNGSDLHWDSQDIMILQVSGRKHWQVFSPTRQSPLQDDLELTPRPTTPPVWDAFLEDGDVLYLPRGWWHIAFPINEPSLHLTFGTVSPNGLDLLNGAILKLREAVDVRRDLPLSNDTQGTTERIAAIRALVDDALSGELISSFLTSWEAKTRAIVPVRLLHSPYLQSESLEDATRIRLASSHRLAFRQSGSNAEFQAYDKLYVVPSYLLPALDLLNDRTSPMLSELSCHLHSAQHAEQLKQVLTVLARSGVVLLEK